VPQRRIDVFFYGLFMDEELLRGKGLSPHDAEVGSVPGMSLRIGQRAALVPNLQGRAYGVIMSLTRDELERLYSEPGVQAYRPQAVLVHPSSGGVVSALCYNLPQPPSPDEHNPEYATKLRAVARRAGLPEDYVASI
jgi:AIG2-like family